MKIDYRIMGRPYRGSADRVAMVTGLPDRATAEATLAEGITGGWVDPNAWVQSRHVGDKFIGEDHTIEIRAEIENDRPTRLGV